MLLFPLSFFLPSLSHSLSLSLHFLTFPHRGQAAVVVDVVVGALVVAVVVVAVVKVLQLDASLSQSLYTTEAASGLGELVPLSAGCVQAAALPVRQGE